MTHDTQQELEQLRDLAKPFRYRAKLNKEEEAIIPGRFGQVEWHSFDNQTFAAYTTRPSIIKTLLGLPWAKRHQRGDRELRVLFHRDKFPEIATILKLRRKRDAPRHLEQFHFIPSVQSQKSSQISTIAVELYPKIRSVTKSSNLV